MKPSLILFLAFLLLSIGVEAQSESREERFLQRYEAFVNEVIATPVADFHGDTLNHIKKMHCRERFKRLLPLDEADNAVPIEEMLAELDQINTIVDTQIDEPHKTIFRLRFDEELTFKEIASRTDLSVGAVYKYLHQCIQRIKSLIQ